MEARPSPQTIYVELMDEGVQCARPVEAALVAPGIYKLIAPADGSAEGEVWQFPPGSLVRCRVERWSEGELLIARELAE